MTKKNCAETVGDFFDKNAKEFIRFGKMFIKNLTNEELLNELARKDLEKLAKVFKLVFELLSENARDNSDEKLSMLLGAYEALGEEEET